MSQPQPKSYLPGSKGPVTSTSKHVETLKACNEDYEWFPTTDEMIEAIAADIKKAAGRIGNYNSLLDVGAGDGRVLKSEMLNAGGFKYGVKKYGIEKSVEHVCRWNREITFVGGDFFENTLTNKEVDVIFSNPPYGEYELWAEKIINESYAKVNYLILPKRWEDSKKIKDALEERGFVATVILESDFLTADRRSRAQVHVIRVTSAKRMDKESMIKSLDYSYHYEEEGINNGTYLFSMHDIKNDDAISDQFEKLFPNMATLSEENDAYKAKSEAAAAKRTEIFSSCGTLVDMVDFYIKDQAKVLENYKKLDSLDTDLFRELNLDITTIKNTLTQRLKSLRLTYWNAFIKHYEPINSRLTSKYRELLYSEVINESKAIDFTVTNALTITSIVIDAASQYQDEQVTDFFYKLSCQDNMKAYKSNQKVFEQNGWRYNNKDDKYTLDYRIIKKTIYHLSESSHASGIASYEVENTIKDICIIAKLVGMHGSMIYPYLGGYYSGVEYGKKVLTGIRNEDKVSDLLVLKFYKNGNQHVFLNKEFTLRLNIYIGKVLGWLQSASQAFDEMQQEEFGKDEFTKIWDDTVVQGIDKGDILALEFLGDK